MDCYACNQEATERCSRCGNPYCRDHGDDLCADCLSPASATPSSAAFRISLFALLAGSVLALWLLVRPPSLPGQSSEVIQPQPTPFPSPFSTPAQPSPTVEPTPTLTPEPEPEGPVEYTVVPGDSWYGIAEALGVDAEELAAANGLTLNDSLHPGDVLTIPGTGPEPSPTTEAEPTATPTPEPTPEGPIEYTVVPGDTLSGIAAAFGVSAEDLAAVNGLDLADPVIQPGDVLVIPQ